jgi:hypothetical protein
MRYEATFADDDTSVGVARRFVADRLGRPP